MKYTPGILREVLHSLIRKLGETPEQFVRRPGRDFTRPRTLRFETVIQQGQLIGYVGSTGNSSGPHLHLALYYNGNPSSGGVIYAEQAWPQYKR